MKNNMLKLVENFLSVVWQSNELGHGAYSDWSVRMAGNCLMGDSESGILLEVEPIVDSLFLKQCSSTANTETDHLAITIKIGENPERVTVIFILRDYVVFWYIVGGSKEFADELNQLLYSLSESFHAT